MKKLIDQFVCVRLVKANGLDLTLFQFDYDLTFAVFFMNADRTIYGRYGSRSSVQEATRDISIDGLAETMSAVLDLHKGYPGNRESLKGKQSVPIPFKTPDEFPSLRGKFKKSLDYEGAVTKSCMHCHQIRDAERQIYRDAGKPIPDPLLFPNPLPRVVGMKMDPSQRATIAEVAKDSAAQEAGLQSGDQIAKLAGQPILSLADIQWVLHHAAASDSLAVEVIRDDAIMNLTLTLHDGWRRQTDISWRVSSWPLRRMVTGGLLFEEATVQQRRDAGIQEDKLALVVKHVGQYGAHAAAQRAGFQKGDIVVSFDRQDEKMSPSQLLAYALQNTKPRQQIPVDVLRDNRRKTLRLPMQK